MANNSSPKNSFTLPSFKENRTVRPTFSQGNNRRNTFDTNAKPKNGGLSEGKG